MPVGLDWQVPDYARAQAFRGPNEELVVGPIRPIGQEYLAVLVDILEDLRHRIRAAAKGRHPKDQSEHEMSLSFSDTVTPLEL
ncbi:MAG: hypothetical protein ACT4QB_09675 [Gammaproteobacteria bacterium]